MVPPPVPVRRLAALLLLLPDGDGLANRDEAAWRTDPRNADTDGDTIPASQTAAPVQIDQVFTHCPKAFVRSDLWNPDRFLDSSTLPSPGEIHRSLNPAFDAEEYDAERAEWVKVLRDRGGEYRVAP